MKFTNCILLTIAALSLAGCISKPEVKLSTPVENMQSLWTTLDERYCYFEEKDVDWDSVYNVYLKKTEKLAQDDERGLFDTLADMVNTLRDGHVNLTTPFDVSRYSDFYKPYPSNFSSSLLYSKYLTEYRTAGPFVYGIVADDYGYIRYSSFSNGFSELNLYYILTYFFKENSCKGLIIDVRDNTGGSIENALYLASYFFEENTTVVYMQHKTGKQHDDFSEPEKTEEKA